MLEAILGALLLVVVIAIRVALSPRTHRAVDRAIKDHTTSNMADSLELYEQMKAAKARGEEFQPPREDLTDRLNRACLPPRAL